METLAAINMLIQLVTLAEEAATAAGKISKIIADTGGKPLTEAQWRAIVDDRLIAQSLLAASIAQAKAAPPRA
jgi:hypothetical protein